MNINKYNKIKYNKKDIVCIWKLEPNLLDQETKNVIQGFGEVVKYNQAYIKMKWIKIPHRGFAQGFFNDKKMYVDYSYYESRYTLLIKAQDRSGNEDWKSLMVLAKLKL